MLDVVLLIGTAGFIVVILVTLLVLIFQTLVCDLDVGIALFHIQFFFRQQCIELCAVRCFIGSSALSVFTVVLASLSLSVAFQDAAHFIFTRLVSCSCAVYSVVSAEGCAKLIHRVHGNRCEAIFIDCAGISRYGIVLAVIEIIFAAVLIQCDGVFIGCFDFIRIDLIGLSADRVLSEQCIMRILRHLAACDHDCYSGSDTCRAAACNGCRCIDHAAVFVCFNINVGCLDHVVCSDHGCHVTEADADQSTHTDAGRTADRCRRNNSYQIVGIFCFYADIALCVDLNIITCLCSRAELCDDNIQRTSNAGCSAAGRTGCICSDQLCGSCQHLNIAADLIGIGADLCIIENFCFCIALEICNNRHGCHAGCSAECHACCYINQSVVGISRDFDITARSHFASQRRLRAVIVDHGADIAGHACRTAGRKAEGEKDQFTLIVCRYIDVAARVQFGSFTDRSFYFFAEHHRCNRRSDTGCTACCKCTGKAEDQRIVFCINRYVCLRIFR